MCPPDSTQVCELAPYPLTAATVNQGDQYQSARVNFNAGTMTLNMVGTAGSRIETKDVMKYGLHEVKLQAAAGVGAVSSFYVGAHCPAPSAQHHLPLGYPEVISGAGGGRGCAYRKNTDS
jgi:hypothetical protein